MRSIPPGNRGGSYPGGYGKQFSIVEIPSITDHLTYRDQGEGGRRRLLIIKQPNVRTSYTPFLLQPDYSSEPASVCFSSKDTVNTHRRTASEGRDPAMNYKSFTALPLMHA